MRQSSHVNPIPIEPFKHIDKYHRAMHLLRAFCCIIHSCHPHLCTDDAVVLIACFVFLHNIYDCYDPTSLEDPAKIPLAASLVLIYGGNDWQVLHVHYSTHGGSNMVLLSLSTEMSCVLCAMFHLCENPQCDSHHGRWASTPASSIQIHQRNQNYEAKKQAQLISHILRQCLRAMV